MVATLEGAQTSVRTIMKGLSHSLLLMGNEDLLCLANSHASHENSEVLQLFANKGGSLFILPIDG